MQYTRSNCLIAIRCYEELCSAKAVEYMHIHNFNAWKIFQSKKIASSNLNPWRNRPIRAKRVIEAVTEKLKRNRMYELY